MTTKIAKRTTYGRIYTVIATIINLINLFEIRKKIDILRPYSKQPVKKYVPGIPNALRHL